MLRLEATGAKDELQMTITVVHFNVSHLLSLLRYIHNDITTKIIN